MKISGFAIVPPISPWDKKHKAEIWLHSSYPTMGLTAGEAWRKHCQTNLQPLSSWDLAIRIQAWMERGYRLVNVTYEILDVDDSQSNDPDINRL